MVLFSYGTLEIADVIETITGKQFRSAAANLPGYVRYLLKGEDYPGIIAKEGEQTSGTVYFDVDEVSMQRISHYEDTCYDLRQVLVTTDEGRFEAMAFVVPEERPELLSDSNWDRQHFIDTRLDSFLKYII